MALTQRFNMIPGSPSGLLVEYPHDTSNDATKIQVQFRTCDFVDIDFVMPGQERIRISSGGKIFEYNASLVDFGGEPIDVTRPTNALEFIMSCF